MPGERGKTEDGGNHAGLLHAVGMGRCGHAYLLVGGADQTRALAGSIAQAAVCLSQNDQARPCLECGACLAVTDSRHVDVRWIEPQGATVKIDQMRALRRDIWLLPAHGRRKVYVILQADRLTVEAANAVLKVLEEPPPHGLIVLTAESPRNMPSTVLSRCQTIRLAATGPEPQTGGREAELAGLALKACEDVVPDQLMTVVDQIVSERDKTAPADVLREIRQLLFKRVACDLNRTNLSVLAECLERTERALQGLGRNANVRLCVDALLIDLHGRLAGRRG